MHSTEATREMASLVENQIRMHPETHNQRVWVSDCGTTACVAGWAVQLAGYHEFVTTNPIFALMTHEVLVDGEPRSISTVARHLLGINNDEEDWLFSDTRCRDEVLDGLIAVREGDSTKLLELIRGNDEEEDPDVN